eukprot:Gb_00508 [translate_table: standard]
MYLHMFGSAGNRHTVALPDRRIVSLHASSPFLPPPNKPSGLSSNPAHTESKHFNDDVSQINPSVVVIIIILTIIFFLSGCLHVLIRFLARSPRRESSNTAAITALEGQLQQLFHLHDSGVEQAFIDTLPVFLYKAVKGLKEGSDCPVCLCEFQAEDKLRLLPKCSHAFHIECIDTWLLSHSTCPLCRGSLLHYFSNLPPAGPDLTFESGDESRDTDRDEQEGSFRNHNVEGITEGSIVGMNIESAVQEQAPKRPGQSSIVASNPWIQFNGEEQINNGNGEFMIMPIKLGKFRNITDGKGGESGSSSRTDIRRSYSMGSYEYVLDPSNLQVFIAFTPYRRQTSIKPPITPGHRPAFSDCSPEHMEIRCAHLTPYEDFCSLLAKANHQSLSSKGIDDGPLTDLDLESEGEKKNSVQEERKKKGESRSWSWLRSKRAQFVPMEKVGSSRRAFSFRLPLSLGISDDAKNNQSGNNRRSLSETELFAGLKDVSNPEFESTLHICSLMHENDNGNDSREDSSSSPEGANSSFAMRTINWLVGRQKRMGHVSSSSSAPFVAEQK